MISPETDGFDGAHDAVSNASVRELTSFSLAWISTVGS